MLLVFALALGWSSTDVSAIEMQNPMEVDPYFAPLRRTPTLPAGTISLWLDSLQHGGADDCREACAALIRADRLGIAVGEQAARVLAVTLQRGESDVIARRAAAAAAVKLNLRQLAPHLTAALRGGDRELERVAEPALARWKFEPMRAVWRARLVDQQIDLQRRVRAYRGLGELQDAESQGQLAEIVLDSRRQFSERMAAAEALARMPNEACVNAAEALSKGEVEERRIAAVLLTSAKGDQAVSVLSDLAQDGDPFVAARAMGRLINVAPKKSLAAADKWRLQGDARLRRLSVDAISENPAESSVDALGDLLADAHPDVRTASADVLAEWGGSEPLQAAVQREITKKLADGLQPLAAEQAALVAAVVGHRQTLPRLVELLQAENHEVAVAAAWAICQMADVETGEAAMAEIGRETARTEQIVGDLAPLYAATPDSQVELPDLTALYEKVEYLLLALGRMGYGEAAEMLEKYVAKPIPQVRGEPPALQTYHQDRLRAAAIWSLGHLHGKGSDPPSARLVAALTARMADSTPIPAESKLVRQMAAVSLGRMGRDESLNALRAHFDPAASRIDVGRACGWAIGQITGVEPPRATTQETRHVDWYLVPVGR